MGQADFASVLVPRSRSERRRVPSLIDVTLDRQQRSAIELPPGQPLLVLGEAGHGKTTVLLQRVARLWRTSNAPLRAAVLVPNEGLARLLQPLLRRLGADIEVFTFDRFARRQARRAFKGLPRESDGAPAGVLRVKRSNALRAALEALAVRTPGCVDDDADSAPPQLARGRGVPLVSYGDLQHLYGDRVLMSAVVKAAHLPAYLLEDILERTRIQFSATTEREWAHVIDRARLRALDGRAIDDGTATGDAGTLDAEDYAVLFELERLRAADRKTRPIRPRSFHLIAVDEAQELAPLELALIGRSLARDGTLVVSGDADQHTDETSAFTGWDTVMTELGAADYTCTRLEIGYRCPPDVVRIARAVRDGDTARANIHVFSDEQSLAQELSPALRALQRRDSRASIAVICRDPLVARRLAGLWRGSLPVRLVFDGHFLPRGPVQLSVVDEVKGLEFDYVVVADANSRSYPDDAAARRALYVAATRARHQLVFACAGASTPLLRSSAE